MAEAFFLLLNEAWALFYNRGTPPRAFDDVITSGLVRVFGKRYEAQSIENLLRGKRDGRYDAEPIEDLLRRAREALGVSISIEVTINRVTIAASEITRLSASYSDVRPEVMAELDELSGGRGRELLSGLTFNEVRAERASLIAAAAAAGYRLGSRRGTETMAAAAREFIASTYPEGIPAGKTNKMLAAEYRSTGARMSERTMRRARVSNS